MMLLELDPIVEAEYFAVCKTTAKRRVIKPLVCASRLLRRLGKTVLRPDDVREYKNFDEWQTYCEEIVSFDGDALGYWSGELYAGITVR